MADDQNGSIHGMSLLVGNLKGQIEAVSRQIEHFNNNFKQRDDAATHYRERMEQQVADLHDEVTHTQSSVVAVQQDVAEMKNDMENHKKVLDGYVQDRPIAVAAFKTVDELQAFMKTIQATEMYNKGFWSAFEKIGKVGWVAISAGVTLLAAIFLNYGVPYLLEMLQRR